MHNAQLKMHNAQCTIGFASAKILNSQFSILN